MATPHQTWVGSLALSIGQSITVTMPVPGRLNKHDSLVLVSVNVQATVPEAGPYSRADLPGGRATVRAQVRYDRPHASTRTSD